MSRALRLGPCLLVLCMTGCVTVEAYQKQEAQIAALKAQAAGQERWLNYLKESLSNLQRSVENERSQRFREKHCKNPKLSEFLEGVARSDPAVCRAVSLDKALSFMSTQPVGFVYLHPGSGLSTLHPARDAFLRDDLFREEQFHPSSRLLILVQPAGESEAEGHRAVAVARQLKMRLREDLLPVSQRKMDILGPELLPCNLRSEDKMQQIHRGSFSIYPLPGEPQGKQPRIRIWIFRSDC